MPHDFSVSLEEIHPTGKLANALDRFDEMVGVLDYVLLRQSSQPVLEPVLHKAAAISTLRIIESRYATRV
jgi:hypothetical protein